MRVVKGKTPYSKKIQIAPPKQAGKYRILTKISTVIERGRLPLTPLAYRFNLRSHRYTDYCREMQRGFFPSRCGGWGILDNFAQMVSRLKTSVTSAMLFGAVLLAFKTAPAAEWPDKKLVGPFVCRADFTLDSQHQLLRELGELQTELVQTLQIAPAKEYIEVYLFHDEETYRRYLKRIYPTLPFRRAFFIKEHGLCRVFAHQSPQFAADLRHECTHALLHAVLPLVPLWLDEGLACYFEVPFQNRLNKAPYFSSVLWNARFGSIPSMDKLENIGDVTAMGKAEYRDSWAWVHFMCQGPPAAHEELVGYLQDLAAQKPPGLLSERLVRRLPSLTAEFKASIKRAAASQTAKK